MSTRAELERTLAQELVDEAMTAASNACLQGIIDDAGATPAMRAVAVSRQGEMLEGIRARSRRILRLRRLLKMGVV